MERAKTIFAGLDNAGKTTIINFVQKKLTFLDDLKPTSGARITEQEFKLLGLEISFWDLGGQERYRERYLDNKQKYFLDVVALIFVIDIKDEKRYDTAFSYLKKLLEIIKEFNSKVYIYVFFHKFDSDIFFVDMLALGKKVEEFKQRILDLGIFHDILFYKTSIYDEVSIIKAFSDITTKLSTKSAKIRNLLKEYCKNTLSTSAILFDTRNFISEGSMDKESFLKVLEIAAVVYSAGIEKLEEFSLETFDLVSKVKFLNSNSKDDQGTVFIKKISNDPKLFLITFTINSKTIVLAYERLDDLAEKIRLVIAST